MANRDKLFMAVRAAVFVALIGTVIAMLVIMFAPDWVVALLRLHSGKQP